MQIPTAMVSARPQDGEALEFTFLTITDMNYSMDNGEYVKGGSRTSV